MCPINTPPTPHVLSNEHPASSRANHAVSRRSRIWGSNSLASFALKLKKGASKSLILSINPPRCEIYLSAEYYYVFMKECVRFDFGSLSFQVFWGNFF